jgi:anti-sigma regulatory factor (Ser/Thr protein kinase)
VTDRTGNDGLSAAIRVPASPDALALIRLFATAVGRQADLAEADVDDLKLALTEVCSAAVEASANPDDGVTVELGWGAIPADLQVHVRSSSRFSTGDPASSDRGGLLDALGLELRETDDGRGVSFAPVSAEP